MPWLGSHFVFSADRPLTLSSLADYKCTVNKMPTQSYYALNEMCVGGWHTGGLRALGLAFSGDFPFVSCLPLTTLQGAV